MLTINPTCKCNECDGPCPSDKFYCSLRCKDKAKRKRRKEREKDGESEVESTRMDVYPESDPETLKEFARMYLRGEKTEPTFFAAPAGSFTPPEGIFYEVDASGIGRMAKL